MKKIQRMVILGTCLLALTACNSKKAEETSSSSKETTASSAQTISYEVVGVKNAQALTVLLKNQTGQEISALTIKDSTMADYPQTMLAAGKTIKTAETVEVYYSPENTGEGVNYSLKVQLQDGTERALTTLNFADIKPASTAELKLDEASGTLYLTYTNQSGETVHTLEAEKAVQVAQAEAVAAAAAAQQAAENSAAETAAAAAVASGNEAATGAGEQTASVSQNNTESNSQAQTNQYEAPANNTNQSVEECLGDDVVFN